MRAPLSATLGAFAGFLIAFALPPWGWWPSAIVGFALFDHLCEKAAARRRFIAGYAAGFVWLAMGELWMLDLTPPGYAFVFVLFGALYGVAAVVAGNDDRRLVRLPAAIVLVEWLRWSWPFGGVPLATVPMTQVGSPLATVLPVAGGLLLTAVTVAVGMALRLAVIRRFDRAAVAIGPVVVVVLIGVLAPSGSPVGTIDVAIVQGGGDQNTRANLCENQAVFERHVAATATIDRDVDLVLWPENVVNPIADGSGNPGCDDLFFMSEALEGTAAVAADRGAILIPGWFHRDGPNTNVNYSTVVLPSGEVVDRYDKVRIVPFGEFVPLRGFIEIFSDEIPGADTRQGTGPAILRSPEADFAIGISWEIFFDSRVRDGVRNGGEIVINPTNGSSYWLTILQSQQVASSQLRAMETGRWVLQAAPTGFSAVVDPDGTVLDRTAVSEQRVLYATVERRKGLTWATRLGAWPMLLLSVLALAATDRRIRARSEPLPDRR